MSLVTETIGYSSDEAQSPPTTPLVATYFRNLIHEGDVIKGSPRSVTTADDLSVHLSRLDLNPEDLMVPTFLRTPPEIAMSGVLPPGIPLYFSPNSNISLYTLLGRAAITSQRNFLFALAAVNILPENETLVKVELATGGTNNRVGLLKLSDVDLLGEDPLLALTYNSSNISQETVLRKVILYPDF